MPQANPQTNGGAPTHAPDTKPNLEAINIQADCVYADPCQVIPESLWGEYCALPPETFQWQPREFRGIRFEVKRTGGDGMFFGACVDSGTIGKFPLSVLKHDFHNPKQTPTPAIEELRIQIDGALYLIDAEADEEHPDPIDDACSLIADAAKTLAEVEKEHAAALDALRLIAGVAGLDLMRSGDADVLAGSLDAAENALGEIQGIVRRTLTGQPLPPEPTHEAQSALIDKLARMSTYGEGEDVNEIAPDGDDAMRVLNFLILQARAIAPNPRPETQAREIIVTVEAGCVTNVDGAPAGYTYRVHDLDDKEEPTDAKGGAN